MLDCNSIDKVVIINLCVDKASIFNRKESMESLKDFIESQAQVLSFGNKKKTACSSFDPLPYGGHSGMQSIQMFDFITVFF